MNDKLAETLAQAAERLGFEASRIWPQIVMVTWITGVFWTVLGPIIVFGCVVGIVKTIRWYSRVAASAAARETDSFLSGDTTGSALIAGCAVVVLAVIAALMVAVYPDALASAFYPEAKTVLRLVGK